MRASGLFIASLLALWLLAGGALANHQVDGRPGSRGDVTVTPSSDLAVTVEVRTEADLTGRSEMLFFVFPRDARAEDRPAIRRVVAAAEPGLYRLDLTLPHAGTWGFSARYGIGLDLYYGFFEQEVGTVSESRRHLVTFSGGLGRDVPRYVQPLGFAIFGVLALTALVLVIAILQRLGRRREVAGGF